MGYALIDLAILPFDGSQAVQIHTARILMLLIFCAAAVLAYSSRRRLTPTPLIASTAPFLTLSLYYSLYAMSHFRPPERNPLHWSIDLDPWNPGPDSTFRSILHSNLGLEFENGCQQFDSSRTIP